MGGLMLDNKMDNAIKNAVQNALHEAFGDDAAQVAQTVNELAERQGGRNIAENYQLLGKRALIVAGVTIEARRADRPPRARGGACQAGGRGRGRGPCRGDGRRRAGIARARGACGRARGRHATMRHPIAKRPLSAQITRPSSHEANTMPPVTTGALVHPQRSSR